MTTPTNCEILAIFITLNKTWKWHFVMTSKYTFSSKVDVPSVILNQLYLLLLLLYLFQYLTRKVHHFKLGFFLLFSVSVNTCFAVDPHISYTNLDISLHFQKSMGECTEASAGLYGIDDVSGTVFLHVTWNSCRRFKKLCECFLWIDNFQRFKSCRNKYFIDLMSLNFKRGYSTLWRIYWYGDE